ncbi:MAG: FMN-binding protein [Ilumatobacteraceae bacterium]
MPGAHASPTGDPLLDRLERLSARQGRAPATAAPPSARTRRRHPARSARVAALVASCATTGGLAYFFAGAEPSQASSSIPVLVSPVTNVAAPTTVATATNPAVPSTVAAPAIAPSTTASPPPAASSAVAAYDGATIDTKYGPVQVQAQVQNGSLVAVAVMQYPNGDGKSVRINQRALPELQSEALTAQSATVHTVSGATYTSNAYVKSLQSAIDKALAAGAVVA